MQLPADATCIQSRVNLQVEVVRRPNWNLNRSTTALIGFSRGHHTCSQQQSVPSTTGTSAGPPSLPYRTFAFWISIYDFGIVESVRNSRRGEPFFRDANKQTKTGALVAPTKSSSWSNWTTLYDVQIATLVAAQPETGAELQTFGGCRVQRLNYG